MSLFEATRIAHFHGRYRVDARGCWVWTGTKADRSGYGGIRVNYKNVRAHRYSWTIDNPPCVNPDHLFLGTNRDNVDDMLKKGRHNPGRCLGEQQGSAKLTWEQVDRIRREYRRYNRSGFSQNALAHRYGVSRSAIKRVVRGEGWVREEAR